MMFRKLKPQRPNVVRKGNKVISCSYYKQLGQCMGPRCLWQKVGICPHYNRIKKRFIIKPAK